MFEGRGHPWVRRLVVVGLVVLVLVLAVLLVHLVFMGSAHHDDSGCFTCLAIVAAGLVMMLGAMARPHSGHHIHVGRLAPVQVLAAIASGRHPPPRGVVLRL